MSTAKSQGFFALDVDVKKGAIGDKSLKALVDKNGELPPGPAQQTPSGGYHYLFKLPEIHVPNNTNKFAPGLDLRSNGYICTGGEYRWEDNRRPGDIEIPDAPKWVIERIAEMTGRLADR